MSDDPRVEEILTIVRDLQTTTDQALSLLERTLAQVTVLRDRVDALENRTADQ